MKTPPKQTPPTPSAGLPAHDIRASGVHGTIWKNETANGTRFNTTFERTYKDGDEWKASSSFGRDDLLALSFVATEAYRWIIAQKPATQPAQPEM